MEKIHSWLTIATSHNYMNKALHQPDTIKVRLRTKIKEEPQMRQGPRSTPTGLHYGSTRTKRHKGQDLHRAPHELGCVICMDSSAPANWFWKYL